MEFRRGSELNLILNIEDIKGNPLRVSDTAGFKLYVWTANKNNYLVFAKRDINTKGNADRIAIPNYFMDTLESGVVCYTYDYSLNDASLKCNDLVYNKVKEVVTDIYWRNSNFNEIPANPVNYRTLEYIRDLIERETITREKEIADLKDYVDSVGDVEEETEARKTADEELSQLITLVSEDTTAAIEQVNQSITDAIDTVNGNIDAEAEARKAADDALSQSITLVSDDTTSAIEQVNQDITDAVSTINSNINTEIEERKAADEELTSAIDTKQDKLTAGNGIEIKVVDGDTIIKCTIDPDLFIIVTVLPEVGEENKFYFVPTSTDTGDIYTEYVWVGNAWEEIGPASVNIDLDDYYTKEEVDSKIDDIEQQIETATGGGITSIAASGTSPLTLDASVSGTMATISGSVDLSDYAKTEDIPTKTSNLTNDSGYITNSALDDYVTSSALDDYYTKEETYDKNAIDDMISTATSGGITTITATGDDVLTLTAFKDNNSVEITGSVDLSDYAKADDIPTKTSDLTNDSGFITDSALSGYAKESDIPTKVSELTNDSGYITSSALNDYVTSSELSDYAKTSDIPTKVSELDNDSGYITDSALSDYAKESDIPTAVSQLTNDSGFITDSALDGYAKESDIPTRVSDLENDADYLTSTDAEATYQPIGDYVESTDVSTMVYMSQSDYDAITPDSKTLYLIPIED